MSHGTAIGNTMRNVAGSLGTAFLITIMSISIALAPNPEAINVQINGINYAYGGGLVMMFIAFAMTIIYVKEKNR